MPNWGQGGKDAATWGTTGFTVGGPVGGVIGAAGGFLKGLFTKDKKKEAAKAAADPNSPENLLKASANKTGAVGDALSQQGEDATAPAQQYYKGLLSSNPSELLAATAPERGRVIDQYDAARQATAEFGPKGGGTASALASSRTQQANQLGDILSTGKREAAGASAQLGTQLTGLGLTAKQLQSADLNSILQSVLTREGFDIEKRGQTMGAWAGVGQAAGSVLGSYLAKS